MVFDVLRLFTIINRESTTDARAGIRHTPAPTNQLGLQIEPPLRPHTVSRRFATSTSGTPTCNDVQNGGEETAALCHTTGKYKSPEGCSSLRTHFHIVTPMIKCGHRGLKLSFVDFYLVCSTTRPILLGQVKIGDEWHGKLAELPNPLEKWDKQDRKVQRKE